MYSTIFSCAKEGGIRISLERRLFSVPQAANQFFGGAVSKATIYNCVARGEIEHCRIGRRILITENALQDFFNKHIRRAEI